MEKKTYLFENEQGIYKLCPEQPSEENYHKKWYFHCITDRRSPRLYSLPNERGQLNNKKLSLSERVSYAQKIVTYYNELRPSSTKETGEACLSQDADIKGKATVVLLDMLEQKKANLSKRTISAYSSHIRILQRYFDREGICEINQDTIKQALAFFQKKGLNNKTINAYRGTISSLLDDDVKDVVLKKSKKLAEHPDGAMFFTVEQIMQLRDAIEPSYPQLWLGCMFIFYCFARPRAELPLLQVRDISFANHTLTFRKNVAKNEKLQVIVIPRPMMDLLYEHGINKYPPSYYIIGKDGKPSKDIIPINRLGDLHKTVLERLHMPTSDYKMYSWKNTGIIEAIKAGIDLVSLQRQVRHHSLDQLNQYLVKVGAIHCADLHTHFKTIDQLKPTESVIGQHSSDFLKLLRNAHRHEVLAPNRYELSLIRAEIDRILG